MKSKEEIMKEYRQNLNELESHRMTITEGATAANDMLLIHLLAAVIDIRDVLADMGSELEAIRSITGRIP